MMRSAKRLGSILCCGIAASAGPVGAGLLPETELSTNCYNFPADDFHRANSVRNTYSKSPHLMLELGAPALDFTLHDLDGNRWNLGEALEAGQGKPVVLIFGMLSCPAYQGLDSGEDSANKWTYWHERALVERYGDKAIFVHVYGPEPHPAAPDLNFDAGTLLSNYWSVWRQSVTQPEDLNMVTIQSIMNADLDSSTTDWIEAQLSAGALGVKTPSGEMKWNRLREGLQGVVHRLASEFSEAKRDTNGTDTGMTSEQLKRQHEVM
eukprot:g20305.t1